MENFFQKHSKLVTGMLSSFDMDHVQGVFALTWPEAMERLIAREGLLNKDFKKLVSNQSKRIKEHAKRMAERAGRPYVHLQGVVDKEDAAKWIAERDGVTRGLVCVLSAVEPCQSFKLVPGKGRPRLKSAGRKCLCLYFFRTQTPRRIRRRDPQRSEEALAGCTGEAPDEGQLDQDIR